VKPRTSPETRALILWAYEHNVRAAKNPKKRKLAQARLDAYRKAIELEREPMIFDNPMERFATKLEKRN